MYLSDVLDQYQGIKAVCRSDMELTSMLFSPLLACFLIPYHWGEPRCWVLYQRGGARASCLELYGAKGFIIAGRVRKGCNHPNYLISDTKVKRYRMSPRSPTIISRLTPCLFSDVNLIDKKKIRNCIYYIEKAFCRFISFYTTLNAAFFKMHKHLWPLRYISLYIL